MRFAAFCTLLILLGFAIAGSSSHALAGEDNTQSSLLCATNLIITRTKVGPYCGNILKTGDFGFFPEQADALVLSFSVEADSVSFRVTARPYSLTISFAHPENLCNQIAAILFIDGDERIFQIGAAVGSC